MRTSIIALAFVSLVSVGGIASAKGCIKGAAVGGVAGHVAGKHGVLGAAAGCAVGRHEANKKDHEEAASKQMAAPAANAAPAAPVKQQ
jgi:hypothetical protein